VVCGGRAFQRVGRVWLVQACNHCLCRVWFWYQLVAVDMLHRIKGIFGADQVPVVSSEHSGFLHYQNMQKILIN
jgi:hypothetical protein